MNTTKNNDWRNASRKGILLLITLILAIGSLVAQESVPYFHGFDAAGTTEGWTFSRFSVGTTARFVYAGTGGLRANVFGAEGSANRYAHAISPEISGITADTQLSFYWKHIGYASPYAALTALTPETYFRIEITTDGIDYDTLRVYNHLNHPMNALFNHVVLPLGAYAGETIRIRFDVYYDRASTTAPNNDTDIIIEEFGVYEPIHLTQVQPAFLSSPVNGAVNIPINTALSWLPNSTYGVAPTGYRVGIQAGTPVGMTFVDRGNTLTFTPDSPLDYNTTYYWQVIPYAGAVDAQNCPIWSFTTDIDPADFLQIGTGTSTVLSPISPSSALSYTQTIYTAAQLGFTEPKLITEIAFNWTGGSAPNSNEWIVYMTNTTTSSFSSATVTSLTSFASLTQVFDGIVNFTATAGWVSIELDTPFLYNGTSNLLIAVYEKKFANGATDTGGFRGLAEDSSGNTSLRGISSESGLNPETNDFGSATIGYIGRPNIRIRHTAPATVPVAGLSHLAIDFETVYTGFEGSKTIMITNIGADTLRVSNIFVDDSADYTQFVLTTPSLPATFTPGQSGTYTVRYAPSATGSHTATLKVVSNCSVATTIDIPLTGVCADARIMSLPHTEDFDASLSLPAGWARVTNTATATVCLTAATSPNSTPNHLWLRSQSANANVIARSPFINNLNETMVTFYARASNAGTILEVGYLTNPTSQTTFVAIESIPLTTAYAEYTVYIITAESNYLAFRNNQSVSDARSIYIDDIVIDEIPVEAFWHSTTTALSLGAVSTNTPVEANFTVTNVSLITPLQITHTYLPEYVTVIAPTSTPIVVPADSSITITYQFILPTAGAYADTIKIASNAINMPTFNLPFTANAMTGVIVQIGTEEATHTNANTAPASLYYRKSYTQTIYPMDSITSPGDITYLSYHHVVNTNNVNRPQIGDWIIWMKHTDRNGFDNGTAAANWIDEDFPNGDWVKVRDYRDPVNDPRINFNVDGPHWIDIPLSTPFTYNGVDNILIAIMTKDADYISNNERWEITNTPGQFSSRIYRVDGSGELDPNTILNIDANAQNEHFPNLRMMFVPVTEPVFYINPAGNVYSFPTILPSASESETFTIRNVGAGEFQVLGVALVSGNTTHFAISDSLGFDTDLMHNNGESASFTITYAPTAYGTHTAVVRVTLDSEVVGDANLNFYEITITGIAGVSYISLPFATDFDVTAGQALPDVIGNPWLRARGELTETPSALTVDTNTSWNTTFRWGTKRWGNIDDHTFGTSAWVNVYYSTNPYLGYKWLITPPFSTADITPAQTAYINFDMALTRYNNSGSPNIALDISQKFMVVISTDDLWSLDNAIAIWDVDPETNDDIYKDFSTVPNGIDGGVAVEIPIPARFDGQTFRIGFYAASDVTSPDIDLFIDNLEIAYGDLFVGDSDIDIVPVITGLGGNYPNPFNPSTTIAFSVGSSSNTPVGTQHAVSVQVDIYNIKGQKVRSLVNGEFGTGNHTVVWNGTDDNGRNVSSGVYFYRMKTDGFVQTKKMILMK